MPSAVTISPAYSGCRIRRYGPSSAIPLACGMTERLRPSDLSAQIDQAVPASSSTSAASWVSAPGGDPCSGGIASGSGVATTAAMCPVTERLVAMDGKRRR